MDRKRSSDNFWNARVCYWPWDVEINPGDAEKIARHLAVREINAVMLNHDHFRWNFVALFPAIEKATRIVVDACHREGISVIEHHSSTITSNPGSYEKWKMQDWANRDVRTGKPGHIRVSHPGEEHNVSWWCCINNPRWKEAYYRYITDFFKNTGVDGLMHDDIHFAPGWFCCGCEHCRAKFKKIFGYSLPKGENHPAWENFSSSVWRDWLAFRRISTGDELVDISRALGHDKILFSCCSVGLNSTLGAHDPGYTYEDFARGANVLYMESIYHPKNESAPLTYSFYNHRRFFLDRKYYQALSEAKNSPCLSYYYPCSSEENFFCWALTKLFGHGYIQNINTDIREELAYFKWEKEHRELFEHPISLACVAILHSTTTMTFAGDDSRYYIDELRGWSEAMIEENIDFKIILADTDFSRKSLDGVKLLILPNITCLSDRQINIIRKFVKNGGNLICTHETSLCDERGDKRKDFGLKDILGLTYRKTVKDINLPVYPVMHKATPILGNCGERIPCFSPHVVCSCPREACDTLAWIEKYNLFSINPPHPAVIEGKYANGKFVYFSFKPGLMYATEGVCPPIAKDYRKEFIAQKKSSVPPLWIDEKIPVYKTILMNTIKYLMQESSLPFTSLKVPEGIMMNSYRIKDGRIILNLLNVKGARLKPDQKLPLKSVVRYPEFRAPARMEINLKSVKEVFCCSPDFPGKKSIRTEASARGFILNIPPSFMKRFLTVVVKA